MIFFHFELNDFTGVNRLTPLDNLPQTFKNEVKDNSVFHTSLNFLRAHFLVTK